MSDATKLEVVEVHPATAERWEDLEKLFGPKGAFAGCWCMYWRMRHTEFREIRGEGTKAALKELTGKDIAPGVLAYIDGEAIGWCSVGPRVDYAGLEHSTRLYRVDETPVWSIVCFFIKRGFRRKGIQAELLRGAVRYAVQHEAQVVEGYPLDMHSGKLEGHKLTGYSGFMGIASVFSAAGFKKVADAAEEQWIMRYQVE